MRRYLFILPLIFILSVTGCATTDDVRRVHGDLNRQMQLTNERISVVEQGVPAIKDEIGSLRKEIEKTNDAINNAVNNAIKPLRSGQAEGRADITEVREQLQQIRGMVDGVRRDLGSFSAKTGRRDEEEKILRDKLDNLTFKINFIENFLAIGKKDETAEVGGAEKVGKPPAAAVATATPKETAGKGKTTDKESLYAAAYELFKEGKYEKSRESFDHFLKQYPESEFSSNAQFWIGECYYFEKKYEKAIVEYEKVTKNFPEGNKVPYALLKQGLAFLKLGDKASARLLLQQVIKDYPNTSQARIARAKLIEIK